MKRLLTLLTAISSVLLLGADSGKDLAVSESAEVKASADQVWSFLVQVNKWPDWNPAVAEAGILSGDGQAEKSKIFFVPILNGKKTPNKMKMELVKSKKPGLYEFESHSAGMDIIFGFKIEEKNGTSTVTSYETIKYPGAKIFTALYGADALQKEHRTWADSIKKALESGQ